MNTPGPDPRSRFVPDFRPDLPDDVQTLAECGAQWRQGELWCGDRRVTFAPAPAPGFGEDGFRIAVRGGCIRVEADTRVARLSALLAVPEAMAGRGESLTRRLRFRRRFYKHEIARPTPGGHPISVYTDAFWVGLCRELVRRHFNGIAIYADANPFGFLGEYGPYERYAPLPAVKRAEYRAQFNRFLATARRYGLETLLQQYVTKFPGGLARAIGLPFYHRANPTREVADFRHPRVYGYLRDMYTAFFDALPGLDRLMLNFENAPNSTDFCREVLWPALGARRQPPALLFRLWYVTVPDALCEWIRGYSGHVMVSHKVMDTMDAYLHPAPDTRIREWRAHFIRHGLEVEWQYLVGPCHNCGSNISRRLWSDPAFVFTLMDRVRRIGSDGFNFHTRVELLANAFASEAVIDAEERALARANQGHLEATVAAVRGERFDESRWVAAEAERLALKPATARRAVSVMRDSSRAAILHLLQFPLTTHEGYAVDARRQLSQHPLYHPPVNVLLNRQHREDPRLLWSYLNKARAGAAYPNDFQTLIDYVDPAVPPTARHPAALAREMMRLGSGSLAAARPLARALGAEWVEAVRSNASLATVCGHDILAGIALFRLYFPATQGVYLRAVDAAIRHLAAIDREVRLHGSPAVHMQEPYAPQADIAALQRLRRYLARGYPRGIFACYVRSVKCYNDIRRFVRPWRMWSPATLRRAGRLLEEARGLASEARSAAREGTPWAERMDAWCAFLEQVCAAHTPPRMTVGADWAPWQPLVHDNCFGYGGFAWQDFLAFFEPVARDKGLRLECSFKRDAEALWVGLRERGVGGDERRERWAALQGQPDLAGVARLFLDLPGDGGCLRQWSAMPRSRMVISRDLIHAGRQGFDLRAPTLVPAAVARWRTHAEGWDLALRLPFAAIGATPAPGAVWHANVASNPGVRRNHAVAWCQGYEVGPGNPARLGALRF